MAAQHREMEEARAAFGLAAMPEAGGGVTDLNKQVGSFADMVAATPPPRPKVRAANLSHRSYECIRTHVCMHASAAISHAHSHAHEAGMRTRRRRPACSHS